MCKIFCVIVAFSIVFFSCKKYNENNYYGPRGGTYNHFTDLTTPQVTKTIVQFNNEGNKCAAIFIKEKPKLFIEVSPSNLVEVELDPGTYTWDKICSFGTGCGFFSGQLKYNETFTIENGKTTTVNVSCY